MPRRAVIIGVGATVLLCLLCSGSVHARPEKAKSAAAGKKTSGKKTALSSRTGHPAAKKSRKSSLTHKVKSGDTLYSISRQYGLSVEDLKRVNGLGPDCRIRGGMVLKVSSGSESGHRESPPARMPDKTKQNLDSPSFVWPLKDVRNYKSDGRDGVNPIGIFISGRPGSGVRCSASGTVEKIGKMRGYGNYVMVRHKGHYVTVYSNLDIIEVKEGEKVQAGRVIGQTDRSDGRLHFQIGYQGRPENPLKYLRKGG
jgi:lipoprotein NlpD